MSHYPSHSSSPRGPPLKRFRPPHYHPAGRPLVGEQEYNTPALTGQDFVNALTCRLTLAILDTEANAEEAEKDNTEWKAREAYRSETNGYVQQEENNNTRERTKFLVKSRSQSYEQSRGAARDIYIEDQWIYKGHSASDEDSKTIATTEKVESLLQDSSAMSLDPNRNLQKGSTRMLLVSDAGIIRSSWRDYDCPSGSLLDERAKYEIQGLGLERGWLAIIWTWPHDSPVAFQVSNEATELGWKRTYEPAEGLEGLVGDVHDFSKEFEATLTSDRGQ